jgi:hypothetical protein
MIAFPGRRSVELKAATASSRVETVPMFVRSRPSRTRWTISLSWARSRQLCQPVHVRFALKRLGCYDKLAANSLALHRARINTAVGFALLSPRP